MKEGLKNALLPGAFACGAFVLSLLRCMEQFRREGFFFWLLVIPAASGCLLLHLLLEYPLRKKMVLYGIAVILNLLVAATILCGIFPVQPLWRYVGNPYILIPNLTYKWHNIFLLFAYIASLVLFIDVMDGRGQMTCGATIMMAVFYVAAAIAAYGIDADSLSATEVWYGYAPRLLMTVSFFLIGGNRYYCRN